MQHSLGATSKSFKRVAGEVAAPRRRSKQSVQVHRSKQYCDEIKDLKDGTRNDSNEYDLQMKKDEAFHSMEDISTPLNNMGLSPTSLEAGALPIFE